jgi:hypothetical protein
VEEEEKRMKGVDVIEKQKGGCEKRHDVLLIETADGLGWTRRDSAE